LIKYTIAQNVSKKTLSKPYAYVRNPVWIETAV
jgi:hypothetical protein